MGNEPFFIPGGRESGRRVDPGPALAPEELARRTAAMNQEWADRLLVNWHENVARKLRFLKGASRGQWLRFRVLQGEARADRYREALDASAYRERDSAYRARYVHWWGDGWEPPEPEAAYAQWLNEEGR